MKIKIIFLALTGIFTSLVQAQLNNPFAYAPYDQTVTVYGTVTHNPQAGCYILEAEGTRLHVSLPENLSPRAQVGRQIAVTGQIQQPEEGFATLEGFSAYQLADTFRAPAQMGLNRWIARETLGYVGILENTTGFYGTVIYAEGDRALVSNGLQKMEVNVSEETNLVLQTGMDAYFSGVWMEEETDQNVALRVTSIINQSGLADASMTPFYDSGYIGEGWRQSAWFGRFQPAAYPWVLHEGLGWVIVDADHSDSINLWHEESGWMTVTRGTFPYAYSHKLKSWIDCLGCTREEHQDTYAWTSL